MQGVRTPPASGREERVTCFVNLQQLRAIETNRLSQLLPSSVAWWQRGVCVSAGTDSPAVHRGPSLTGGAHLSSACSQAGGRWAHLGLDWDARGLRVTEAGRPPGLRRPRASEGILGKCVIRLRSQNTDGAHLHGVVGRLRQVEGTGGFFHMRWERQAVSILPRGPLSRACMTLPLQTPMTFWC